MIKTITKMGTAMAAVALLAGCVATQPIAASSSAGFVAGGFSDGFQDYICTAPRCGGDGLEVGHRTESGGVFAPLLDAALDNPANRQELADEFFSEFASESGIQMGATQTLTIGGFDAYQAGGTVAAAGMSFPAHIVLIVTESTAEIFLAVADTASEARRGTTALARAWAQTGNAS